MLLGAVISAYLPFGHFKYHHGGDVLIFNMLTTSLVFYLISVNVSSRCFNIVNTGKNPQLNAAE